MSTNDLPPLSPELARMFRLERQCAEAPPPDVVADLATRLALPASLGASASGVAIAARAARRWAAAKIAAVFVAGATVGSGLTYVAVHDSGGAPLSPVTMATTSVSAPNVPGPSSVLPDPAPPETPSAAPPANAKGDDGRRDERTRDDGRHARAVAPHPSATATIADAALARERGLVETARSAVVRRDGASALAAIGDHEREFPNGRMAEEREVLAIQALLTTGREAEARARATRFRQRYPNGLFRPLVDDLVPR